MMVACGGAVTSVVPAAVRLATPPDLSGSSDACMSSSPTPLIVDQLKNDLLCAADNNNVELALLIVSKLEKLNLTKEQLEISRIGAVVNDVRKRVSASMPTLSTACRNLIKHWRKTTETYTRSSSSCGGSNGVTPSMISPAIRRLVTPQTPHKGADGGGSKSQTASPQLARRGTPTPAIVVNGTHAPAAAAATSTAVSNNCLVANAVERVKATAAIKRKINEVDRSQSPANAAPVTKRNKALTTASQEAGLHSLQTSVSALRGNAQSTTDLVAQLTENLPQHLATDLSANSHSASVSPNVGIKITIPRQQVFQSQSSFNEKRKYTKRAPRFFKNGVIEPLTSTTNSPNSDVSFSADSPASTLEPPPAKMAHLAAPALTLKSVASAPALTSSAVTSTTTTASTTPKPTKIDWSAGIISLEELSKRIEQRKKAGVRVKPVKNQDAFFFVSSGSHKLLCFPFVNNGDCDLPKELNNYRTEVSYPRAYLP